MSNAESPSDGRRRVLVLYSKADCPLCDRLELMIRPQLAEGGLKIEKRDIEDDDELRRRFSFRIPVLASGDRVILEGRPDEADARKAMNELLATLDRNTED